MVRGKKSRKSGSTVQAQTDSNAESASFQAPNSQESAGSLFPSKRFTLLDYIVVCAFFIAFCLLQQYVALKWFGVNSVDVTLEGLSLKFFFGTMWKGFLIVALLALLHDFFYQDSEEEDTA